MSRRRVFVTDFGLARSVTTGSRYTRTGDALGTPAYMSPEQARGERELTPASDVWALGCLLYEALSGGRRAFDGESPAAIIGAVMTVDPVPVPGAPRNAQRLVDSCLQRDPSRRHRTAAGLRTDADRVLAGQPPLLRAAPSGRWRWPTAVAVVVGLGAVIGWAATRPASAPTPPQPVEESLAVRLARDGWALRGTEPARGAELLAKAVALEPQRHEQRVQQGLLLWAVGRNSAAVEAWTAVPSDATAWPQAQLYLGLEIAFRLLGKPESAAARPFAQAAALGAGATAQVARALLALQSGDKPGALAHLEGVPGWEAELLRSAALSEPVAKLQAYNAALKDGIWFAWALQNRGAVKATLQDPQGEMADYEAALAVDPRSASTLVNRGVAKKARGDRAGAVADFSAALDLDPTLTEAWFRRAQARDEANELQGALADYEAMLKVDARSVKGLAARAGVRERLGDPKGALADYDAALVEDPTYVIALSNRGALKDALDDVRGALADYDASLAVDDRQASTLFNRGSLKERVGDREGALADFDAAVDINPKLYRAFDKRAGLKDDAGDLEGALADWDTCLSIEPTFVRGLANRGGARARTGDWPGAAADFAKALELAPADWPYRGRIQQALDYCRARVAETPR